MAIAIGLATVIYVAVSIGVFGTLSVPEVIAAGPTAIAVAAQPVLGDAGYWLMTVTALFATAGATNSGLYPATGLSDHLASSGQFPTVMARRLGGRAPFGLIILAAAIIVVVVAFDLTAVASIGSAVALVIFAVVTLGHLRILDVTGARRSIVLLALAAVTITLATFIVTTLIHEPASMVTLVAILVLSIVLDVGWSSRRDRSIGPDDDTGAADLPRPSEGGSGMTAATSEAPAPTPGGRFALPSAYTILFILIVIVAILTWIIPAGAYDVDPNGEPIPGTYHSVPANPQRIVVDSLMAPINGLYGIEAEDGSISVWNSGELFGAIDVALFILVIGGFLGVTMKTGAIETGIARIVGRLAGRERLMIPILMIVFALGGTTFGMSEESLAFYALIITVMIAAGYDALVAASVLLLGCGIGVLGSTINPFATGIASGFAGVSIEEGIVGRLVILVVGTAIGIFFVLRYADRVKADPSRSLVFAQKAENEAQFQGAGGTAESDATLTGRQKIVLVLFILAFAVMIYGVIPWEDFGLTIPTLWWWFPEMTASFLLFAILIGVAGRMSESSFTSTFVDGARDLLGVALIIGIARGITVVMNNGLITDTVLNWAELAVADLGGVAFINLMYVMFLPLSFLIPSSSGLATVAMPIMAPLATFADVPAQFVVTAYQSANGLVNLVTPTSAVVMGGLAIARVGYGTWLRFVWPVLVLLAILTIAVLTISVIL